MKLSSNIFDKVVLGTANFGMPYGLNNSNSALNIVNINDLLKYSQKNQINYLDTAEAYGSSQEVLGRVGVQNFKIITKVKPIKDKSISKETINVIEQNLYQTLKKLKVKSVDTYLIHHSNDLEKKGSQLLYDFLIRKKEAGLINNIGVSAYSTEEVQSIVQRFNIDVVQMPFNIIDRRILDNNFIGYLQKNNVDVHARSIFLQGLLLKRIEDLPKKFIPWKKLFSYWHSWLNDNQISALTACSSFALRDDRIEKVVFGVDNKNQLDEIINSVDLNSLIPPSDLSISDEMLINPANWSFL